MQARKPLEQDLDLLIYELRRNYPSGCTTWGKCYNPSCQESARGSGQCVKCLTGHIGRLIGCHKLAMDYQQAYKRAHRLEQMVRDESAKQRAKERC